MENVSGTSVPVNATGDVAAVQGSSMSSLWESAFNEASSSGQPGTVTPESSVTVPEAAPVATSDKPAPSVEEFEIEGKKYKVEKTAKEYAIERENAIKGMRKAFAERDALTKKFKEKEPDLTRYSQILDSYKSKGIEGLVDAISGKEGSYQEEMKRRDELTLRKYNATESELHAIKKEEEIESERRLRTYAENALKETVAKIESEKAEANKEVLTTRLSEAFETVDFEGKLGDAEQETEFNQYVWEKARVKLKEYADSKNIAHHEIPSRVIKSTFVDIASRLDKTVKSRAAAEVKTQVQDASDIATRAAQAKSVTNPSKEAKTLEDLVEKHSAKWNPNSFLKDLFGG
jgi:hypothetical protein